MKRCALLIAIFLATAAFAEPPVDVPRKPAPKAKPAAKAKAQVRPAWAELTAEDGRAHV